MDTNNATIIKEKQPPLKHTVIPGIVLVDKDKKMEFVTDEEMIRRNPLTGFIKCNEIPYPATDIIKVRFDKIDKEILISKKDIEKLSQIGGNKQLILIDSYKTFVSYPKNLDYYIENGEMIVTDDATSHTPVLNIKTEEMKYKDKVYDVYKVPELYAVTFRELIDKYKDEYKILNNSTFGNTFRLVHCIDTPIRDFEVKALEHAMVECMTLPLILEALQDNHNYGSECYAIVKDKFNLK